MYASRTEIANAALRHIGVDKISSINSTSSANARRLNDAFMPAARAYLSAHPWNFANQVTELAAQTNDREDWAYKHVQSVTDLHLRNIWNSETGEHLWRSPMLEGQPTRARANEPVLRVRRFVYSNAERLTADFVPIWDEVEEWPSIQQDAFSMFLGGRVCYLIKGDYELGERFTQIGIQARDAAFAHDLNQDQDELHTIAGHHAARGVDFYG